MLSKTVPRPDSKIARDRIKKTKSAQSDIITRENLNKNTLNIRVLDIE